ncbi:MAG: ChbG/HpnK family deacetylase, partial [Planctomycetota bacterium JB042]
DLDAAESELRAQLERARAAGLAPAHLDGHHHVHVFPGLFERVCALAREHGVPAVRVPGEPARLRHPGARGKRLLLSLLSRGARETARRHGLSVTDHFRGLSLFDVVGGHHSRLLALLEALPEGATELMVHPRPGPAGEAEVRSLTDPATRTALDRLGVRLATFGTA